MGISQPQIHNVLKGARTLHPVLADRFLRKFGITALELVSEPELNGALALRRVSAETAAMDARLPCWKKPAGKVERLGLQSRDRAS